MMATTEFQKRKSHEKRIPPQDELQLYPDKKQIDQMK